MAEAVGTVAAVVQLVELSGKVLCAGYGFLSTVIDAPGRLRNLLTEVSHLNFMLDPLRVLAEDKSDVSGVLSALEARGVFDECRGLLDSVGRLVEKCSHVGGQRMRNFGKSVKWPFQEKEAVQSLQRLERLRSTLSEATTLDAAAAIKQLERSDQKIHTKLDRILDDEGSKELLDWILPTDCRPEEIYDAATRVRKPGSGQWLLESKGFKEWTSSHHGLLWLHGLPESGKTVICTTVIETLHKASFASTAPVVYFYCDHANALRRKATDFFVCTVRQLLQQGSNGLSHVRELLNTKKGDLNRSPTSTDYLELLKKLGSHFTHLYVVVDALDESLDPAEMVDAIKSVSTSCSPLPVSTIVTSREEITLEKVLGPHITMELSLRNKLKVDVNEFIASEIDARLARKTLKLRDPAIAPKIERGVKRRADGV